MKIVLLLAVATSALFYFATHPEIKFIGDFVLSKEFKDSELAVGGLSALFFSEKRNRLIALSDDSRIANPRFYELSFDLENPSFKIEKEVLLKKEDNTPYEPKNLDLEGLVELRNGDFILSSEGLGFKNLPPQILVFQKSAVFKGLLSIPEQFTAKIDNGLRNNRAFEGLSISSDEKCLFAANEEPLKQDMFKISGNNFVRIMHWRKDDVENWKPDTQYAYPLRQAQPEERLGLSEVYHIEKKYFLTLERGHLPPQKITADVFIADCNEATDLKEHDPKTSKNFKTCTKRKLIAVNDFEEKFKHHNIVDNLEGLAVVKQGRKNYIVLVSDDNFRNVQRNQFLVFQWEK